MVKIVNPLGDVKIGKQGEVVYQRKYGEQIRRTVSPKRAIPSQAQIAHRQLYRAALTWRSQLSLANRRYLEGYCYANGIVDSYHIPLPWSRFALKLYLQKVKFVIVDSFYTETEAEEKCYESYEETPTTWSEFYGIYWRSQSFTPQVSHKITKVGVYLRRRGLPGTCRISIRDTDAQEKPTGPDLTGVDFNGNELGQGNPTEFTYFNLPPYQLLADIKYAIVERAPLGRDNNELIPAIHFGEPLYPRGVFYYSTNSGSTWTLQASFSRLFEEWGKEAPSIVAGAILHIRHPALMKIVHKRGDLSVNGYDTLSSLDEQYLTDQVGLDVESGDLIKATTLPGIEYAYKLP